MPTHTKPLAHDPDRLARCSPAYRAAVTGRRELPATKTKCGAVQFRVQGFSERVEGGHTIIRATLDEGQVVELKLPKGWGVVFPRLIRSGKGYTHAQPVDSEVDTEPAASADATPTAGGAQ
jgi:hypothetical protein